ncbi:cell division protein FtsZ [Bacillaceae bacterium W0354]
MEAPVKIYQMNNSVLESDKSIIDDIKQSDLCFYRFIGGNDSETETLTNSLMELKEQQALLIGVFRFPFQFEGKKRFEIARSQYFRMRELCDAIIYFKSDALMEMVDESTPIHEAYQTFNEVEEDAISSLKQIIQNTGDMNIDYQDIETFIKRNHGPLFVHNVEGQSFNEPLKYLISSPYLPEDFTDGKQLIINIGYTREIDMEAFRLINLRLNDLFSKADLFKLGSYLIDEPGERFKITLIVNGIDDPVERPQDYKKVPKYKAFTRRWHKFTEKQKELIELLKN